MTLDPFSRQTQAVMTESWQQHFTITAVVAGLFVIQAVTLVLYFLLRSKVVALEKAIRKGVEQRRAVSEETMRPETRETTAP